MDDLNGYLLTRVASNSGLFRAARSSGLARPTAARRAFQPITSNLAPALGARFASQLQGKVHQVIGAVVDGMLKNPREEKMAIRLTQESSRSKADQSLLPIVKFDTDQLPPILNALNVENAGNKLVLEVAVSYEALVEIQNVKLT